MARIFLDQSKWKSNKTEIFADYLRYPVENVFVSIEQINSDFLCVRPEKITDDVKKWGRTKVEKVALEAQPSVALIFLPPFKPFSIFF